MLKKIIWRILNKNRVGKNWQPRTCNITDKILKYIFEGISWWRTYLFSFICPLKRSYEYTNSSNLDLSFTEKRIKEKPPLLSYVVSLINDDDLKGYAWIELGCCDGANLITLNKMGFTKLSGVEINREFLDIGKKYDEKAFSKIDSCCDSIEHFVTTCKEKYDVVFTSAVLQHVNPLKNDIFRAISNLSKKYIITIEAEDQCNYIHFRRNYQRIFSTYGFSQLSSTVINKDSFPSVAPDYIGYTIRVLMKC